MRGSKSSAQIVSPAEEPLRNSAAANGIAGLQAKAAKVLERSWEMSAEAEDHRA